MREIHTGPGPFRVEHLTESDRYELDDGHGVYCAPSGAHHAKGSVFGARVLSSDPAVTEAGIDAGYTDGPGNLRAPDIAIGNVPDQHGWISGAPRLAVEYAGVGQDDDDLEARIEDLLNRGTEWVWVARLVGPRRVEIHAPGEPMRVAHSGDILEAPGILQNGVAVDALFDERASLDATLTNLLQREGYDSLDAVRSEARLEGQLEGQLEGRRKTLADLLGRRFGPLSAAAEARLALADGPRLEVWTRAIFDAPTLDALLDLGPDSPASR